MGLEESAANSSGAASCLELLRESFPEGVLETSLPQGDARAVVLPGFISQIMTFAKQDPRLQFNVLVDITAVDFPEREPRFDVVYNLLSIATKRRLRIITRIGGKEPTVESLTSLWGGANWLEREVWDMFGISFAGHPDLRRILLYEEFEGHPLRKDYPTRKRQPLVGPKN
jgi:NADH-quinone oxidoreductase subunit C